MSRILMMMLLVISMLFGIVLREVGGTAVVRSDRSPVIDGNNQFAIDLYRAIRSWPGNVSLAPASLSTALAMAYEGARGETADEMARTLHLPADRAAMRREYCDLLTRLNGAGEERPYRLDAANALWGQEGDHFLPDFTARLADTYGAEIHAVDFRHAADSARVAINGWVDGKTNHLIPELLSPRTSGRIPRSSSSIPSISRGAGSIRSSPRGRRHLGDFHPAGVPKVTVPMMHLEPGPAACVGGRASACSSCRLQGRRPSQCSTSSCWNEGVTLDQIEADFSLPGGLQHAIDRLGERQGLLDVMPRFTGDVAASEPLARPARGPGHGRRRSPPGPTSAGSTVLRRALPLEGRPSGRHVKPRRGGDRGRRRHGRSHDPDLPCQVRARSRSSLGSTGRSST